MSEELEMEALRREWRNIDMKTIEMALETGKLRRKFTWSFVLMTAIMLLIGLVLIGLALDTTWRGRLPGFVVVGVGGIAFLWFFRRQWRAVHAADMLLTGTPIHLIRGRKALLEAELYTWDSRVARSCELFVGWGAVLGATVLWWFGHASAWVPLVMAIPLASMSAYGRLHRIPWLHAEIAKLERLARALA